MYPPSTMDVMAHQRYAEEVDARWQREVPEVWRLLGMVFSCYNSPH